MPELRFVDDALPSLDELLSLYRAVGWTTYTDAPARLAEACSNSTYLLCVFEEDALVGVCRSLSDGVSIHYLQDIVVAPSHQGRGIGRSMVERALQHFGAVRAHVLMTDDRPEQLAFYRALGFTPTAEHTPKLNTFVRFRTALAD